MPEAFRGPGPRPPGSSTNSPTPGSGAAQLRPTPGMTRRFTPTPQADRAHQPPSCFHRPRHCHQRLVPAPPARRVDGGPDEARSTVECRPYRVRFSAWRVHWGTAAHRSASAPGAGSRPIGRSRPGRWPSRVADPRRRVRDLAHSSSHMRAPNRPHCWRDRTLLSSNTRSFAGAFHRWQYLAPPALHPLAPGPPSATYPTRRPRACTPSLPSPMSRVTRNVVQAGRYRDP